MENRWEKILAAVDSSPHAANTVKVAVVATSRIDDLPINIRHIEPTVSHDILKESLINAAGSEFPAQPLKGSQMMMDVLKKFERVIVLVLIVMMMLVVLLATVELGWIIVKDIVTPPMFLLEIAELLEIFGFFLLVLIGVELLETLKAYLKENVVHVEIVLEVALIAIARKVIILDLEKYGSLTLMGIAALIVAVAVAFYAVKKQLKTSA